MAYGPDLEQAYDAIFSHFKAAWDAGTPPVNGGAAPEVEWPDSPEIETPLSKGDAPWARIAARHTAREVSSISTLPGMGRTCSEGVVMVNIFVPAGKRGLTHASRLGKVALAAFEGQRAGDHVWFTDATPEEVGVDGAWFQFNVKAKFHYHNHL